MLRRKLKKQDSEYDNKPMRKQTFVICAGEASGDAHGAELLKAMLEKSPTLKCFGMGGEKLKYLGMELVIDAEKEASVMGLTEVAGKIIGLFNAYHILLEEIKKRKPDLVILLDFPDFNLRVAKAVRKLKIPVMYYIAPQVWAWRTKRINSMKRDISRIVTIFPFEKFFYESKGIEVDYVGHPFVDRIEPIVTKDEFFKLHNLDPSCPTIALLPGSRNAELRLILPELISAFRKISCARPGIQGILPVASGINPDDIRKCFNDGDKISLIQGEAYESLKFSDVAIVASGTATVEAALAKVPFVVVYKLSAITFILAKLLVKGVSHIAMPNLIAGKKVIEELVQERATAENIAVEVERILGDPSRCNQIREELGHVRRKLTLNNTGDRITAAKRAADIAFATAMLTEQ